jgi:hypothetical protein
MTDLQNTLIMFIDSNETFAKIKSGDGWCIEFDERKIQMYFDKNGKFTFIYNIK